LTWAVCHTVLPRFGSGIGNGEGIGDTIGISFGARRIRHRELGVAGLDVAGLEVTGLEVTGLGAAAGLDANRLGPGESSRSGPKNFGDMIGGGNPGLDHETRPLRGRSACHWSAVPSGVPCAMSVMV